MVEAGVIVALVCIMVGCMCNVISLEFMVKEYKTVGHLVTFAQFSFIGLEGLLAHLEWKGGLPRLAAPRIPIREHLQIVALFGIVSILNNWALAFHIPMPLHMVFRSASPMASMIVGYTVMGKRYPLRQIAAVLLLTSGVVVATSASMSEGFLTSLGGAHLGGELLLGIGILVAALVLTSLLGLVQERQYAAHGKHPRESLFYSHLLSLPLFVFLHEDIAHNASLLASSEPMAVASSVMVPWLLLALAANVLSQYVCIRGVFLMTSVASSLTTSLVLVLRKFASLLISIFYFQNDFTPHHWVGTALVVTGTAMYMSARRAGLPAAKPKAE